MEYSSSPSLGCAALIAEYGNKQVGDARPSHFAERGEFLAFDTIEQQDAAPENLAFVNRLHRPCGSELFGLHHHFQLARLEFVHTAIEYDAAAVNKHDIGQDVLNLFHLMGGHHDGAASIEVVIQQRIVELLAIENIQGQGGLVQHQQFRINGHDQSEVQLCHHALRQFPHLAGEPDGGLGEKTFCLRAIESRMHAREVIESLPNAHPARQHRDIGNEAGIAHKLIALSPRVASEHLQFPLIRGEAENCVEDRRLAGAVGTDEPEDAALLNTQIDAVHRDGCSESLPETTCFYTRHGFNAPLCGASTRRFSTWFLRQHLVVPLSGRAVEWLREPGAILQQETSAVRPAATDCARRY